MSTTDTRAAFEAWWESEPDEDKFTFDELALMRRAWNAAIETTKATCPVDFPEGSALKILRDALWFYADKEHFIQHQDVWESVSGEPENFLEDESHTATVEDGTVAKNALNAVAGYTGAKATSVAVGEMLPLPEPLEIDWPELNSNALGCGVEDRGIRDRYDAAEYGWQDGVDKAIERVPEAIYDANQMREYGQQCAEAARQPTPEVELPEGWKTVPRKMTDEQAKETAYNINRKYKVAGPLSDFLVRQIWEFGIYASPNPPAGAARQPAPALPMNELAKKLNALDMAIAHSTNLTPHSKPRRLLAAIIHEVCSDVALAATAAPVLSDEQVKEILFDVHAENGMREEIDLIKFARAVIAATRSQP